MPEATALIADTVCEAARDGRRLAEAIEAARTVLGPDDVLPGVPDVVTEIHVEAVFDDGSRLAVINDPFRRHRFAARTRPGARCQATATREAAPEVAGCSPSTNTATVPISVTSHFHFFEVNPRLAFDRAAAYGMRLACPAGSSVRFEPGAAWRSAWSRSAATASPSGSRAWSTAPWTRPAPRERAAQGRACGYLGTGPREGET